MNYQKFTIKNYRCFSEEQTLHFAQPISGKIGSGITYIVGPNNSGKTTLIEGMWLSKDNKIKSSEKKNQGPELCIYSNNQIVQKVNLIRSDSYTLKAEPELKINEKFETINSRRHWESSANATDNYNDVLERSISSGYSPRQNHNFQTASILKDIEKDEGKYKQFISLVQKVIPEFTKWAVGYEDNEYIEYIAGNGTKHKTDFLGDGVISIIRILAHLFSNRKNSLVIDEPELSLHPLAQKKLAKLIAKYAEDRQIIISTHSPYFISWEYIKNGAKLNRVTKTGDTSSKIYTLQDPENYSKLIGGDNWQQPYLMDVVSKEIFFQENILFVEGQEDVGLLQPFFATENINFFGYGVRGYSNFNFALQLAHDLGIEKASVIIDSPANPEVTPNENDTKREIEEKYGAKYKIVQWHKNDIRDKEERKSLKKEGYFNKSGTLKDTSQDQKSEFNRKITEIKEYFNLKVDIKIAKDEL